MKDLFLNKSLVEMEAAIPAEALSLMVAKVMREHNLVYLIDELDRPAVLDLNKPQSKRDQDGL